MGSKKKNSIKPVQKAPSSQRSGFKRLVAKFFEHEAMTFIGKGFGWLIENYHVLLPIGTAIGVIYASLVEEGLNSKLFLYAKAHPERISIVVIILAVLSPVIKKLVSLAWQKLKVFFIGEPNRAEELPPIPAAERLILATGISGFYPHSKTEKKKDWKICVEKIKQHRATDLRIMGATGWNTFGFPQAPLYKLLEQFNGEVKILLIEPDPTLPALIQRAQATLKTPDRYSQEVERALDRLKVLKHEKGKNISVKLYTQTPIWKMVISNDFMWLQHYRKDKNVEDTPVYTFFSDGDEGTSLFHPFYSVWFKRWENDGNKNYNL